MCFCRLLPWHRTKTALPKTIKVRTYLRKREYRKNKRYIHLKLKVPNNHLHLIVQLNRHKNWSTLHPQIQILAGYNGIFCQSLNPERDQPNRCQSGNSKSVSWLSLFFQSNKPTGRLGEARQSGNSAAAAELAVLSRWARLHRPESWFYSPCPA